MVYSVKEISKESGQPIELYEFTIDTTTTYFTSAEDNVTYSAAEYTSLQIERTAPTLSSGETGRQQMEIRVPSEHPIAARYIGIVPPLPVYVRILRFHRGDSPNGIILWDGRIVSAKFVQQGARCILFSVSSEAALSRPIPGRKYQGLCNHRLGDSFCGVNMELAANKHSDTVMDVTGDTITVNGVGAKGDGWAQGGIVVFGDDRRLVTKHVGNVLTLQMAMSTSPLASVVDVYAGCDHSQATCHSQFANTLNYGGFPDVPWTNPFNNGVE